MIIQSKRIAVGQEMLAEYIELHMTVGEVARAHRMQPRTCVRMMCEAMEDMEDMEKKDLTRVKRCSSVKE